MSKLVRSNHYFIVLFQHNLLIFFSMGTIHMQQNYCHVWKSDKRRIRKVCLEIVNSKNVDLSNFLSDKLFECFLQLVYFKIHPPNIQNGPAFSSFLPNELILSRNKICFTKSKTKCLFASFSMKTYKIKTSQHYSYVKMPIDWHAQATHSSYKLQDRTYL